MFQFLSRLTYAVKPLRFLLLTEVILLSLVFAVPQGEEILHISLEQYQSQYTTPGAKAIVLLFLAGSLSLLLFLIGALFSRTLLLYRRYKHFDAAYPELTIRRMEQIAIYLALSIPSVCYLVYWFNEMLAGTWPVAFLQIIVIIGLFFLGRRDDQLLIHEGGSGMGETYLFRITQAPFRSLSLLVWAFPLFLLMSPDSVSMVQYIGPLGIIMLAAYVLFHLVYLLHWTRIRWNIPSFLIGIVWIVFCSYFNGNHLVQPVDGTFMGNRPGIDEAVRNWVTEKVDTSKAFIPVYIVAAEGGGSRAAVWTAGVLRQLEANLSGFRDHLLAISSVSGGTVGAGYYLGARYLDAGSESDTMLWQAVGSDLLSPLLSGFFFSDLAQQFLPFPIYLWDRSRRLEYAMSRSMAPLVAEDERHPFQLPSLELFQDGPYHLINSTIVESGTKGIWSPLRLEGDVFAGVTDLGDWHGQDVQYVSALVNSARFPLVTPGGMLKKEGRTLGHLVDGGYFENTGIETAYSVLRVLDDLRDEYPIRPIFIYIQNSRPDVLHKPAGSTLTASNPIRVFYQAWSSRSTSNHALVEGLAEPLGFQSVHIPLEHAINGEPHAFPLAWVLSNKSLTAMYAQLDTIWDRPELGQLIRLAEEWKAIE